MCASTCKQPHRNNVGNACVIFVVTTGKRGGGVDIPFDFYRLFKKRNRCAFSPKKKCASVEIVRSVEGKILSTEFLFPLSCDFVPVLVRVVWSIALYCITLLLCVRVLKLFYV